MQMESPSVPASEQSDQSRFHFHQWLPWLILFVSLTGTVFLWESEQSRATEALQRNFNSRLEETANKIDTRMRTHIDLMRGMRALFAASDFVSHDEFRAYINTLRLTDHYPGVNNAHIALYVPKERKQAHIAMMHKQGFSTYAIKPEGERSVYAPVIYIEPTADARQHSAFGYDNYFDISRRGPADTARDSGQATLSDKLTLVTETTKNRQVGFLMRLAFYTGGEVPSTISMRRAKLAGWVGLAFRMDDLMRDVLGGAATDLDIGIYDGEQLLDVSLMYDNQALHGKIEKAPWFAKNKRRPFLDHLDQIAARL